ncbi:MAG: MBL fold metallo-hydrolase, partial [Deltaproteobacteria bacterium]|nr:MBL fold metallo-hydrolase [Deltaproteobacteria bacterium]
MKTLIVGPLEVNCYIVGDEKTKEAICIDPGGNVDEIMAEILKAKLCLKYIINTHGHFDHVGGNAVLKKTTGAKFAIHKDDAVLLENVASQSAVFGLDAVSSPPPDLFLKDGDEIRVGNMAIEVIHTPGHTRGGISLFLNPPV